VNNMKPYFSGGHYSHFIADITPIASKFKAIFGIALEFDQSTPFPANMPRRCIPVKLPKPATTKKGLGIPKPSTPSPDPKDIDLQGQDSEGRSILIQQIIPTYSIYNHAQAGACECGGCKYFASYHVKIAGTDQQDFFRACSVHVKRYKSLVTRYE
jgi:hypothetical protein